MGMGVGKRLAVSAATAACAWCVLASPAAAHPLVDEGVQLFDEADFGAALAAFDRAAASDGLSREELVRLTRYQALAHFANEDMPAMERDLLRLAELEPGLELGPETPPRVRSAFGTALHGLSDPLALDVQAVRVPNGVEVRAVVRGDPADLVGTVNVSARTEGGAWVRSSTGSVGLPASAGEQVEIFAYGVGPGGVTIVSLGSIDAPETRTAGPAFELDSGSGDGDDGALFIGLGVGGGVLLVATAVLIIVLVADGGSDETQFAPPRIAP